ncbi:Hypothetical predicted protein [Podarcis lilfordi]|uniref:Uncharacterized protein n=1 Tax=Podarcis lilfordi TaxID=74358 RepID=A0AA35KKV5_9SAUR|nr:Hypothetical predicted protein [Podarcis lilfordi]
MVDPADLPGRNSDPPTPDAEQGPERAWLRGDWKERSPDMREQLLSLCHWLDALEKRLPGLPERDSATELPGEPWERGQRGLHAAAGRPPPSWPPAAAPEKASSLHDTPDPGPDTPAAPALLSRWNFSPSPPTAGGFRRLLSVRPGGSGRGAPEGRSGGSRRALGPPPTAWQTCRQPCGELPCHAMKARL